MRAKLLVLLVVLLSAVCLPATAAAAPLAAPAKVSAPLVTVINGESTSPDSRAVLVNGVIMLPLRVLADRLGLVVSWMEETRTVRLEAYGKVIYLPLGGKVGLVNGKSFTLLESAQSLGDRTFVPVRFLSEVLAFDVRYSSLERKVDIRAPEYGLSGFTYAMVDGRPQIQVTGTHTPSGTVTLRENPLRLVAEFPYSRLLIPAGTLPTDDPLIPSMSWSQVRRDAVQLTVRLGRPLPYQLAPSSDANRLALVFPPQVRDAGLVVGEGKRLLTIRSTAPVHPVVKRLADPDRLVIDVPGVSLAAPSRVMVHDAWVQGIRLGQLDDHTVRVVADLEGPLGWAETAPAGPVSAVGGSGTTPAAPDLSSWTLHLYNRVSRVGSKTLKDRTQLSFKLAVPATPTVLVDRQTGRLEVDLAETLAEGLAAEVPVRDGTVERLRLLDSPPGTVRWAVDLPYYVGHQILPGTATEVAIEVSRSPVYRQRIYLDPGHGGSDPGAISPGGLMEKDINLDISLRLRQLLTEAGAVVTMARETDVFIPLFDRPRQANAQDAAIFVSVHSNANTKSTESGTETYFHPDHPGSRELAEEVQAKLMGALKLVDRGIRANRDFVVIRESTMPGILVETAFVSNPTEEKLLGDPAFRQKVAGAIADGIMGFFKNHGERWPKSAPAPPVHAPGKTVDPAPSPQSQN